MDELQNQLHFFTGDDGPESSPIIPVSAETIHVGTHEFIDVEVLDLLSHNLRMEAEEHDLRGFVPPSLLFQHIIDRQPLPAELAVPPESRGLNMHNLDNLHYVLSYKDFVDEDKHRPRITVFDSLPVAAGLGAERRFFKIKPQIEYVYGEELVKKSQYRTLCAQKQSMISNDCGLFTLANAILILDDRDPCDYDLADQNMRQQLANMLAGGNVNLRHFKCRKRFEPMVFDSDGHSLPWSEELRISFGPVQGQNNRLKEALRRKLRIMEQEEEEMRRLDEAAMRRAASGGSGGSSSAGTPMTKDQPVTPTSTVPRTASSTSLGGSSSRASPETVLPSSSSSPALPTVSSSGSLNMQTGLSSKSRNSSGIFSRAFWRASVWASKHERRD